MNDMTPNEPTEAAAYSIPENTQLVQLREAAAEAAAAPDLHERVRVLTANALHDRRISLEDVRDIARAVTEGVGRGLTLRGGEMKSGLKQAVAGLDEAFGHAAQSASYTLREAVDRGRAFQDSELKMRLETLRDLESQFVDTLRATARESRGALRDELEHLAGHLKVAGTQTGAQVREALTQMACGLRHTAAAGREGLGESAGATGERLAQVASGVLAALAESLKRQSERLRS